MCTICGCSGSKIENHHEHKHEHKGQHHHYGEGDAGAHVPGLSQSRLVSIEQNILAHNDRYAAENREHFASNGQLVLNLVSSPGSGKTTLLVNTLELLKKTVSIAVIEGDQQTTNDAERIRATGVPAIQVNTGKGCHLDAHMVGHAVKDLALEKQGTLFIENVGNLVCPAAFDLGEHCKVAILSVTEGEDKPLKYPDMFAAAELVILNKIDLLPHLAFDLTACRENILMVNPQATIIELSATTGEGVPAWLDWLNAQKSLVLKRQKRKLLDQIEAIESVLADESSS
ncbi:hydrogenase accessory protein HypB [Grimontia hollisae]|uniref:Hydrogenase maturation factor HypB n=2 Tax=Grimontia hollisae TaxID=673 RepID=D0IAG1_GRIHO|nr:hydrogenase nickel incorporation protein HypB [Grimontia hollisae]AMG31851.1 hydrogenase accessory protein HypB [Grimontia hollisae]EEY70879.1 [NiFe] hydrogenase nickel incorporation-associated protein HypB [Grimontia hollisae CIP 101886]MDF2186286.1 hydrogenase nickel incorporation protein HypB [Grimontia hollisae]STO44621.1 Hydrogenase isoenzymes nickel incorporation protein hypB [Grimontia hollisae]STO57478.1 Hydrogenase isoenzymes nickel incorporation protein hypB [Grimontia hollisae]